MSDPPGSTSAEYHAQQGPGDIDSTFSSKTRRSRLFFGICDMRTATVALDILNIGFTVVVAVVLSLMFLVQGGPFVFQNIMFAVGVGLATAAISVIGLWGAMNWNLNGLYVATLGFLGVLVWRLVRLDWVDILVSALLLYPHVMLTFEMRNGILTPENFEQEEFLTEQGKDFVEMAHHYISPKNSAAET